MGEELNTQNVGGEPGAAPEAGASTEAPTSSEATTETTGAPDIQAQIDTAVQAAIDKYEGKGGHLAKLRSQKDKEIATLKRQLRERQTSQVEEAKALLESDPAQAAQILAGIVEAQAQTSLQENRHQEVVDYQYRYLAEMGADPEEDEEAAELAAEWAERVLDNPDMIWDFQHAAGSFVADRERKRANDTAKQLKDLQETMPDLIKAEVTKALVSSGVIPEPGGEGTPPQKEEDWRSQPSGKLIKMGLEQRMKEPIQR